jgi:hypothetical protein
MSNIRKSRWRRLEKNPTVFGSQFHKWSHVGFPQIQWTIILTL